MTLPLIILCGLGVLACGLARNGAAALWAFTAMLGAIGDMIR